MKDLMMGTLLLGVLAASVYLIQAHIYTKYTSFALLSTPLEAVECYRLSDRTLSVGRI